MILKPFPLKTSVFVLTSILSLIFNQAHAQVYKKIDEKGKVIFTDKPIPDAVPIELRKPNTSDPVEASARRTKKATDQIAGYMSVEITSPIDKTVIPNGLLPFTVTANIDPALKKGHSLQLLVDGETYSENTSGSFRVSSIVRGPHTLQVRIVDAQKLTIKQSPTISIQAYRPKK